MANYANLAGKDIDEMLEDKDDLQTLDEKIAWLNDNFSMDELKELENRRSRIAEEAMISRAREEAGEEKIASVIQDEDIWRDNPEEALGRLEKAIEYDEGSIRDNTSSQERARIFQDLLNRGKIWQASQFDELVDSSIRISRYQRDDEDADEALTREKILEEAYQDKGSWTLEGLDQRIKMAQMFGDLDVDDYDIQKKAAKLADQGNYEEAMKTASQVDGYATFSLEDEEDQLNRDELAQKGYEKRLNDGDFESAARIAQLARRQVKESSEYDFEQKEAQAAENAVQEYIGEGEYESAIRVAQRYEFGNRDQIQAAITKAALRGDITDEEYEELTDEIGYQINEESIEEPEQQENYDQRSEDSYEENGQEDDYDDLAPPVDERDDSGILGRIRNMI